MSLWRRMVQQAHERSLWQVLGIYAVSSWVVFQVVLALHDALALPDWVPPVVIILFIVGLPIVIATAFIQEGPPKLERRPFERDSDPTLLPGYESSAIEAEPAARQAGARTFLTWRRSLSAGVAAFALLAVVTAAVVIVRQQSTLLAQGVMTEADQIVLADFGTTNVDPAVGRVVTEALRIDLLRSTVVRLADPARIESVLKLMQHEGDALDASTARQAAQRAGWKAVLAGEVGQLGGGYVLSAELRSAADGSVLVAFRSTARDSTELIDAVDDLSRQVRDRVGEPLKQIRGSDPLQAVTTSSLAALQKYAEAERIGRTTNDYLAMAGLLEEAIALDSTFAMAWRRLGTVLNNLGIRADDVQHALAQAYMLRDRLPEVERRLAEAMYYTHVDVNPPAAMEAYRRALTEDSTSSTALNNLASLYIDAGRMTDAEALLQRAVRDSMRSTTVNWTNLIFVQHSLGQQAEARATLEKARRLFPDNPSIALQEVLLAGANADWDTMETLLSEHKRRYGAAGVANRVEMLQVEAGAAMMRGRIREGRAAYADLRTIAQQAGLAPQQLAAALEMALATQLFEDPQRGLREAREALERYPLTSMPRRERPYFNAISVHIIAGDITGAESIVDLARKEPSGRALWAGQTEAWEWGQALLAMHRGDPDPMIRLFESNSVDGDALGCALCGLAELGQAYERAGRREDALRAYEQYLDRRELYRAPFWWYDHSAVLLRAGELHEELGDREQALRRYGEYVDLMRDADPVLQPRVAAARRRMEALRGRG